MSTSIELDLDARFELGDRVRIVVSSSNFFGWTGTVKAVYKGDFELGVIHYHVLLDNFVELPSEPALLFRQLELAYSS